MNSNKKIKITEKGWECPKCGQINAPHINKCSCVKSNMKESNSYNVIAEDGRTILNEGC